MALATTRSLIVPLIALTLATAAFSFPPVTAQNGNGTNNGNDTQDGNVTEDYDEVIYVKAHDEGTAGPYWFTVNNGTEQNPDITIEAGMTYLFIVENVGQADHNFHILAPIDIAVPVDRSLLGPGEIAREVIGFPDGFTQAQYQCDPHAFQMTGTIGTAAAIGDGDGNGAADGGDEGTPGFGLAALLAATVGALALASRRRRA